MKDLRCPIDSFEAKGGKSPYVVDAQMGDMAATATRGEDLLGCPGQRSGAWSRPCLARPA
eukprot:1148027-Pelagomonas_calceolata.AAC.3